MNHKRKIIEAIKKRCEARVAIEIAKAQLRAANNAAAKADSEVARQIKNVLGPSRKVLFDGHIYSLTPGGELIVSVADFEVLSDE